MSKETFNVSFQFFFLLFQLKPNYEKMEIPKEKLVNNGNENVHTEKSVLNLSSNKIH